MNNGSIELEIFDEKVHMVIPPDADSLLNSVRDAIPGVSWNSIDQVWTLPLTTRSVKNLRKFLTGTGYRIGMSSETAGELKSVADQAPATDAVVSSDAEEIIITFEFHPTYQNAMQDLNAKLVNGSWVLPISSAVDLVDKIEEKQLDLVVSDDIKKASSTPPAPLERYDGTLLSLAKADLDSLDYVQRTVKRDKKKKSMSDRFADNGVDNLYDLIHKFPLRYIDRSSPRVIRQLTSGETAAVLATVTNVPAYDYGRNIAKIIMKDSMGVSFSTVFFRQRWISSKFREGDEVVVYGKYEPYHAKGGSIFPQFANAQIDKIGDKKRNMPVVPVYPQSEKSGITTADIAQSMQEMLSRLDPELNDPLPVDLIAKYGLLSRQDAYKSIHFPQSSTESEESRKRLVYEELLGLQLHIQQQKRSIKSLSAVPHVFEGQGTRNTFVSSLPYSPTGAQQRAMNSIFEDMSKGGWNPTPMHRLLQGDVGAGKTVIAMWTLLSTMDAGHQGALMAPTEILAEQLYFELKNNVEKSSLISPRSGEQVVVEFLGSKTKAAEKRRIQAGLADGTVDVVVGTHALISKGVSFADLGAVVIDEQHRFGAAQRTQLRQARSDGKTPHLLVMTATPIPRTHAMVMYGDLDLTILDELPPGRVPIATTWSEEDATEMVNDPFSSVWDDVLTEVGKGHQAYIIASLVEDSEKIAAQSAEEAYVALSNGPLSSVRVGMVHGRQPGPEREAAMNAFAAGEIDVLVATTVIEVGVNVPNSTVIVVMDAGRFGIAQLHQIRGRVGRSSYPSRCYLVGKTKTTEGRMRLEALVASTDGFYLAEKDLEIRGEGTLFGDSQAGESDLKIARLRDHLSVLEDAKRDAEELLLLDPSGQSYAALVHEVETLYKEEEIKS